MSNARRTKTVITDCAPDGTVRCLHEPETAGLVARLGVSHTERLTHVEPVNGLLRMLFYLIRRSVSDTSWLAAFTRTWPCKWRARVFNGPILGPFALRRSAIDAEREWLMENVFHYGGAK